MNPAWADRLGGVASLMCAVHCLVMAFAPVVLTVTGLGIFAHEAFEWVFFGCALGFAGIAAVAALVDRRPVWVLGGFALGIPLLMLGRAAEALSLFEGGGWLAIAAGLLLAGTHIANLQTLARLRAAEAERVG